MESRLKNRNMISIGKAQDCMSCIMYEYHSHLIPQKIENGRQKHWDDILTKACNICNGCNNYHSNNGQRLTDHFIEKLALKLKEV